MLISPPFLTVSVNSASGIMPKNIFSASSGLTLLQNRLKKYSLSVHRNSISPSSWLILTTLYPLSSICVVSFGDEISFLKSLGISSKQSDDTVLAEYKDFKVTQGMVNFQKRAANLAGDNPNIEASDYTKDAIIDRLLIGRMLVEEAESRGVAATKAEMEENLSSLKASYNDYPEVKKQVDEYCSGAGLSIDEYWTQVYDQSYDQISRTNLRIQLGKDFCSETGYNGSVDDALMTDEFDQYYNDHRAQLLKEHQSDVKYYS